MENCDSILEAKEQLVLRALYSISRNTDVNPFEDFLRSFVGQQAYILFTFEKTLNLANKAVSTLITEESNFKALRLHPDLSLMPEPLYHECFTSSLINHSSNNTNSIRVLFSPETNILTIHNNTMPQNEHMKKLNSDTEYRYWKRLVKEGEREGLSFWNKDEDKESLIKLNLPVRKVFLKRNAKALSKGRNVS